MRLLTILLTFTSLQAAAHSYGQVSLSVKDEPLEKVLVALKKQSGYEFFYNENMMRNAQPVTLTVKGQTLEQVLELCFNNQPRLGYVIISRTVVIKDKPLANPLPTEEALPPPPIEVKGRVVDENGQPVVATVMVKGTQNGTTTDANGYYTLSNVDENATLVITSVSMEEPVEVKVNKRGTVNVDVKRKIAESEEIVVAYNKTTAHKNVSSISIVKGEEVRTIPNRSVDKSLQGLVPGLLVTSGTGQPGGGLSNFVLRGIATGDDGRFGSTLRNPLIVVDGIPVSQDPQQLRTAVSGVPYTNPMAQLNPSDIEAITVLKDAAAVALYGSKAANGVILLTTKKGRSGKPSFNFRHQTDISRRLSGKVKLLNQQQYLELLFESYRNTTLGITDLEILNDIKTIFPTKADGSFYPQEDLASQIYTSNASTITNELSISGGNDRSVFYLNMEWTKQNGVYKNTGFDRKSLRFNFENRPFKWFNYGMNVGLSYNVQDYIDINNDPNTIITMSSPLQPIRDEGGSYFLYYPYLYNASNPVAIIEYNLNRNIGYRALTKFYAGINMSKHLKFTSNLGVDFGFIEAKEKYDPRLCDPVTISTGSGRVEEASLRNASLITTNILAYDNNFTINHNLNVLAGQEAQILTQRNIGVEGYPLRAPYYNQVDGTTGRDGFGNSTKQTLVSYFGQINYGFKNKYFLSLSTRLDGSSKFGENQKYGNFWSAGTGWILSNEKFIQKTKTWLNFLKIRGSLGKSGNSGAISRFTKYDILQTNLFAYSLPGVYPGLQPANPAIRWEQTFTLDAGVEARFFNNRIVLAADVYQRKTSDLIYLVNLANVSGYISMLANIGDMENKGTEISLSIAVIRNSNFKWDFHGNLSTNKNKLLKANVNLSTLTSGFVANEEGRNFNSFYLRRWAGVNPADGLAQYIDSTGVPNSDINASKPAFVGKPQPDGFGAITNSFSYKQLKLSFMLYYQYGFQVYDNFALQNDGSLPYSNQDVRALDRWQKPGDHAANPVRTLFGSSGYDNSTRRLYDGDYIRLQNVNISYDFPSIILKKFRLNTLQLFVQAHNVAVWTKFPGADISNTNIYGNSTFNYPNAKTYSLGVNVGF